MATVFISYRRADSQDITGRIYDRLVEKYTSRQVFKDVNSIPAGVSFPKHIRNRLRKTDAMLVIIGRSWLHCMNERGQRRLDDPNDFVRLEVEQGLRRKMPVIPVLVANARMPQAAQLPQSMQRLASRNCIKVRPDPDFNSDIAKLVGWVDHFKSRMSDKSRRGHGGDSGVLSGETTQVPDRPGRRWSRRTLSLLIGSALLGLVLLAAACTMADAGYDLADRNLPEGAVIRDETHFTMTDGTETRVSAKRVVNTDKHSEKIHRIIDTEILQVMNGDPSKLKVTFVEHAEFDGRTLQAEKVGGIWKQTLIGAEPTPLQARALKTEWGGIDDTYPERRIKPGYAWKLEGQRMRRFVQKSADALFFEGTAEFEFVKVVERNHEQCAQMDVRCRYKLRELDNENREVTSEVSMSGQVYRSISRLVDVESDFSGESKRAFTKIENGQMIDVVIAGPVKLKGRQSRRER